MLAAPATKRSALQNRTAQPKCTNGNGNTECQSGALPRLERSSRVTVHSGGSVRVAQIRGLITQRDEGLSHIKEPARSSGLGLQARPEHPGLR